MTITCAQKCYPESNERQIHQHHRRKTCPVAGGFAGGVCAVADRGHIYAVDAVVWVFEGRPAAGRTPKSLSRWSLLTRRP
ncbi:MAG: hypothetical protein OXU62_08455 [Gammaproteobacteria bacterium]|nr:hypothetical protein [Gammaproteobacteria bacterium]